jgi:hypothetical protein
VLLGPQLRPINLGRAASGFVARLGPVLEPPQLIVSVHARSGWQLGYAVVDRAVPGETIGGMTVSEELSVYHACALARATRLQLAAYGMAGGSHHCLVTMSSGASSTERVRSVQAFHEALLPLVEAGLCRIVEGEGASAHDRELALEGRVASATAATLATLRHLSFDPRRSRLAVHDPRALGRRVADRLVEYGLRRRSSAEGLQAEVDVLLIDGEYWVPSPEESIRAPIVVALCATEVGGAALAQLVRGGVLLVPHALAGGGGLVAVDLWTGGLDRQEAVTRAFEAAEERTDLLLKLAEREGKPLSSIVGAPDLTPLPMAR